MIDAPPRRIESHAHAERELTDTPYLAYCLMQACKLFVSLVSRRWPELR
jgi:hypothetical protein